MRYLWIFLLCISPVWAHQSLLTDSGEEVRWTKSRIPLVLKLENSNQSSSQQSIKNVIENSINEWNKYSAVKVVSTSSDPSGNSLSFVKNFPYGRGVLGVTEVKHSTSGVIESSKIFINDDYSFSTSTGLYGHFLGDVVTHELGHMIGLGHSEVLDSTMFYSSFTGHHTLAQDDISGVRGKYEKQAYGRIFGVIQGGDGVGILGTHVQVISRTTGESVATVSRANGEFEVKGLNINDTYYIYTSPAKNLGSLPSYFSNSQSKFCPGPYKGSFFSQCGFENKGIPQGISLGNLNTEVNVGVVTINCDYRTSLMYEQSKRSESGIIDYPEITSSNFEKALSGWFTHEARNIDSAPDTFHIDLSQLKSELHDSSNLFVRVIALAYPFGSEIDLKVKVLPNLSGTIIPGTNNAVVDVPLALSSSKLEVQVTSMKRSAGAYSSIFPVIEDLKIKAPYPYLLVAGIVEKVGTKVTPLINTEAYLSDNSSCLDAPFAKSVEPIKVQVEKLSTSEELAAPSCGTIDPPSSSGPGSSLFIMTLGFFLSLLVARGAKSSKKFLS